ncbi:MAG TPA: hypothetical protein VFU40_03455 [Gemmatimonadales bacterium]|nr:hypothetical protein [Gemmatimonadales bacterium]
MSSRLLAALLMVAACDRGGNGGSRPSAACGLAALAGPTALLSQFSIPNQTLGSPPRDLPERLVVRFVAGPAYAGIVGHADSALIIGADGAVPPNVKPGFGVLILDQGGKARGVLVYEGPPVEGAPELGKVAAGDLTVPLIGIQLDPAKIEDPRCPLFPDSVIQ